MVYIHIRKVPYRILLVWMRLLIGLILKYRMMKGMICMWTTFLFFVREISSLQNLKMTYKVFV